LSDPHKPVDGRGFKEKRFQLQKMAGADPAQPAFQFLFPELNHKEDSLKFAHLKEMESRIVQQAKGKILGLEKEAYEKGFVQGEKNGLELGQKKVEAILQQLKNLICEIERQRTELYKRYEKEMVQLVLGITQKILQQEVQLREEVVANTLQAAFQYVVDQKKLIVHLHPSDYKFLLAHPELRPFAAEESQGVKMVEDPSISRGGCLLETSFGVIDATLDSQFEQIAALLWQRFEQTLISPPYPP